MSNDELARLDQEIAALEARYGGQEQASRLLAARRRAQELRALATTEETSITAADLRAMTPEQVAKLKPETLNRVLGGAA